MTSALTFELRRADGTPAKPSKLTTVAPSWRPGDTLLLARRTLRILEIHDIEPDGPLVLLVEDVSE